MKQSLTIGDILLQVTLWMTSNVTLKTWHVTSFLSHGTYFNRSWSNQLFQWTCYRLYLPMHVIHSKTERKKVAFVYLFFQVKATWKSLLLDRTYFRSEKNFTCFFFFVSSLLLQFVSLWCVCMYVNVYFVRSVKHKWNKETSECKRKRKRHLVVWLMLYLF